MWRLFFRRSWLAGLLLAASLADRGNAAPFDFDTLKTIPLMDVVRLATIRYDIIFYVDDAHKALILKEIDGLDPKVRTLVWLAILESDVVEGTIRNGAPTRFESYGHFLSRMKTALADAGMDRRRADAPPG